MTVNKYERHLCDNITEKVNKLIIKDTQGNIVYTFNYSANVGIGETEWYYLPGAELIYYRPDKKFYHLSKLPDQELTLNNYIFQHVMDVKFTPPKYRIYGDNISIYDIPPIHISGKDFIMFNMVYYPDYYAYDATTNNYKVFPLLFSGYNKQFNNIESANYDDISQHIENISNSEGETQNLLYITNTKKQIKAIIDITELTKPDNKYIIYDLIREQHTKSQLLLVINNTEIMVKNVSYAVSDNNTELIITDMRTGSNISLELDNLKNNNLKNIYLKIKL